MKESFSVIHGRREMEEPSSLYISYCQVPVEISQKLGMLVCLFHETVGYWSWKWRRPWVSQLRLHIYYSYFDIVFVFQMPFLVWVLILS